MVKVHDFLMQVIEFSALLMATLILMGVVTVVVLYIIDITQTQQAIRRNYPVIGRFRYLFEHLGVFFSSIFLRHGPGRIALQSRTARLDCPSR